MKGIREDVVAFAHLMERELAVNDERRGRDSWRSCYGIDEARRLARLGAQDMAKLSAALLDGNVEKAIEQAADTANMMMMVAYSLGGLTPHRLRMLDGIDLDNPGDFLAVSKIAEEREAAERGEDGHG